MFSDTIANHIVIGVMKLIEYGLNFKKMKKKKMEKAFWACWFYSLRYVSVVDVEVARM